MTGDKADVGIGGGGRRWRRESSPPRVVRWCSAGWATIVHARGRFAAGMLLAIGPTLIAASAGAVAPEIVPQRILPVEGPRNFQPSGLALDGGALFTVSDKHDGAIYRLELGSDRAVASVALRIRWPKPASELDLEGIAPDGAGGFFVVSEAAVRVLRVPADGPAEWATDDLRPFGLAAGMLVRRNATFEGLAWLGPRHFLLAAERDARGLIEVDLTGATPRVVAQRLDDSPFAAAADRTPDFTDLVVWRGRVFALLRNACVVCELLRGPVPFGEWREGLGFSFGATEHDPRLRYQTMKYGLAEGLALDDTRLYLVLDNNDEPLAVDPADRRSRLLVFANPFADGKRADGVRPAADPPAPGGVEGRK